MAPFIAPMLVDMSVDVSSNSAFSFARMFAAFFESCFAVSRSPEGTNPLFLLAGQSQRQSACTVVLDPAAC